MIARWTRTRASSSAMRSLGSCTFCYLRPTPKCARRDRMKQHNRHVKRASCCRVQSTLRKREI